MYTRGLHWLGWLAFGCWLTACISAPPLYEPTATATLSGAVTQTAHPGVTISAPPVTTSGVPSSPVARPTVTSTEPPPIPRPTPWFTRANLSLPTPEPSLAGVTMGPPAFISFTVTPLQVRQDETFTITWITTNAESVSLTFLDYKGRLGQPSTSLPLSGSLKVDRSKIMAVENMYYSFTMMAVRGHTSVYQGGQVDIVCETTWFVSPPPPNCPWEAQSTPMVAQRFEHGLMLWAKSFGAREPTIIVLYYNTGYRPWETYQDNWVADLPENDPSLIPPSGLYQPIRGFGLLWREGHDGLLNPMRERLGWALAPEVSLGTGVIQCERISEATCYLTGPDNHIYVLRPEQSEWYIWTGTTPTPHY
jgi:hypothetical protein